MSFDKIHKTPKAVTYMRLGVHKIIKNNKVKYIPKHVIVLQDTNKKGQGIDIYV